MRKLNTDSQKEKKAKSFEMPHCEFCYASCGNCRYYSTENFSGFCDYYGRNVSASDTACSQYS